MTVTPGNYLHGWILGFGGDAKVEAPPDLRDEVRARVEELKGDLRLRLRAIAISF